MSFPTTLDTTSTIPVESSSTSLSTNHVTNHTASQTAIIALETKVGVDGSAVTSTHDYKLSGVTGTDKAVSKTGTETLTNKTLTSPTITGATITTSSVNGVTIQTAGSATDFLAANGTYQTGAVANSSTTVKGIVEEATQAEITAATASGGTGARLFINPSTLSGSSPAILGTNITDNRATKVTRLAGSTAPANTSENTIFTTTVNANMLGSTGMLHFSCPILVTLSASTGVSTTFTIRVKFGGTTIGTLTITNPTTGAVVFSSIGKLEAYIVNATSATQNNSVFTVTGYNGMNSSGVASSFSNPVDGTSSVTTTSNQTFEVTVQKNNTSNGDIQFYQAEIITCSNA